MSYYKIEMSKNARRDIRRINEYKINILRIFNQKENYLNQRNFILKEDTTKYLIKNKRKFII